MPGVAGARGEGVRVGQSARGGRDAGVEVLVYDERRGRGGGEVGWRGGVLLLRRRLGWCRCVCAWRGENVAVGAGHVG